MVNSGNIYLAECTQKAVGPPIQQSVSHLLFSAVPPIERISPSLSGFAEIIWWNAGNTSGAICFWGEFEEFLVSPYIRTIKSNVDGQITNQFDIILLCVPPEGIPLGIEEVLFKTMMLSSSPNHS